MTNRIMQRVIDLSRQGVERGHGAPFGCVIVKDSEILAEAYNEVLSSHDPTAHAETLAIRRASRALESADLTGCDLYTNGVPCCMCMASTLWAGIRRVYYILPMADSAAIGLGDEPFYAELARAPEHRQIVPLIQDTEFANEARAVYDLWNDKRL